MENTLIPMPIEQIQPAERLPTLTYRLDLDAGRIVGKVDGLEAVNQAIKKAILTPRFKCLIYDNRYGSEIEDAIIAQDASREYAATAIEGFVKDALLCDTRILAVKDYQFAANGDRAYISFRADTIYGTTEITEVI